MKCGNVNRDDRKQTLDARFIPWFGSTQSLSYSTLLKHSRRVSLLGHQVSFGGNHDFPPKAMPPRLTQVLDHLGSVVPNGPDYGDSHATSLYLFFDILNIKIITISGTGCINNEQRRAK